MEGPEFIDSGYLAVQGDTIVEIGFQKDLPVGFAENHECEITNNSICLPGFINSHIHLSYEFYKGLNSSIGQLNWLYELVQISRGQDSAQKLQIAQTNLESAICSGTTCIVENTPFVESFQALHDSRIKALIGLEVFGNNVEQANEIFENSLQRFESLASKFGRSNLDFTFSPHSIYNVSAPLLTRLSQWTKQQNKQLLLHLAEFAFENELTQQGCSPAELKSFHEKLQVAQASSAGLKGVSPVQYLAQLGCLGPHLLATHLIQTSPRDLQLLSEYAVSAVSCPRSNSYLMNGSANLAEMYEQGLIVSFATDGLSSNLSLSLLEEIKTAWFLQRSNSFAVNAKKLFEGITINPAKQLGLEKKIGSLAKGKKADFVQFKLTNTKINLIQNTQNNLYEVLLKELTDCAIEQVWIDGVS